MDSKLKELTGWQAPKLRLSVRRSSRGFEPDQAVLAGSDLARIWGIMERSCSATPSKCAELRRVAPLSEVNPSRAGKRAAVYGLSGSPLRDVAESMDIAGRN